MSYHFSRDQKAVLQRAISTWGERQQINKAIEELAELIQALAKWQNREVPGPGFDSYNDKTPIYKEMADVAIMMEQLQEIFGEGPLNLFMKEKLAKLEGYLNAPV